MFPCCFGLREPEPPSTMLSTHTTKTVAACQQSSLRGQADSSRPRQHRRIRNPSRSSERGCCAVVFNETEAKQDGNLAFRPTTLPKHCVTHSRNRHTGSRYLVCSPNIFNFYHQEPAAGLWLNHLLSLLLLCIFLSKPPASTPTRHNEHHAAAWAAASGRAARTACSSQGQSSSASTESLPTQQRCLPTQAGFQVRPLGS